MTIQRDRPPKFFADGRRIDCIKSDTAGARSPRLLERLRGEIRVRHYSLSTEVAYVDWCKRYIRFHGMRHPAEMGAVEVTAFLTHLAAERRVSAPTQNQALSALLFRYRHLLCVQLP